MTQHVTTPAVILSRRAKKEPTIAKGKTKTQCAGCPHSGAYKVAVKVKSVKLPYCASPYGCVED